VLAWYVELKHSIFFLWKISLRKKVGILHVANIQIQLALF